ncbi:MAG: hypothetical protein ABWW70_07230 [Thermoproteota archaeon]
MDNIRAAIGALIAVIRRGLNPAAASIAEAAEDAIVNFSVEVLAGFTAKDLRISLRDSSTSLSDLSVSSRVEILELHMSPAFTTRRFTPWSNKMA